MENSLLVFLSIVVLLHIDPHWVNWLDVNLEIPHVLTNAILSLFPMWMQKKRPPNDELSSMVFSTRKERIKQAKKSKQTRFLYFTIRILLLSVIFYTML